MTRFWLIVPLLVFSLQASASGLMSHFKGRYGAIEIFDVQKKLAFRVNAPELSQARNFCQFNDLSLAIAAVEFGLFADFDTPVDVLLQTKPTHKPATALTLKRALRLGNQELFDVLREKIGATRLAALAAKSAIPTKSPQTSAFALLDWFKAFHAGTLALQPKTKSALNAMFSQKRDGQRRLLAFSSRCAVESGALGASIGFVSGSAAPVFFAISVDGKSRSELFQVAPGIRDAALNEMGYWGEVAPK